MIVTIYKQRRSKSKRFKSAFPALGTREITLPLRDKKMFIRLIGYEFGTGRYRIAVPRKNSTTAKSVLFTVLEFKIDRSQVRIFNDKWDIVTKG